MKARDIVEAVKTWSYAHEVAASIICGLLVGFILGKLL